MRWAIKTDNLALGDAFSSADCDEMIIAIDAESPENIADFLQNNRGGWTPKNLRFALPPISRSAAIGGNENAEIVRRVKILRNHGAKKWQIAQLGQLGQIEIARGDDCSTDWNLYVLNVAALEFWRSQGISHCALSPEDDGENLHALLKNAAEFLQVIVYQDSPWLIGEACPKAAANNLHAESSCEKCNGSRRRNERNEATSSTLRDANGRRYILRSRNCRSTLFAENPFSLSGHLADLASVGLTRARIDFVNRDYSAESAREIWKQIIADEIIPSAHNGNFSRGIR